MPHQITVIATLHARAGQEDALQARLQRMQEETRKEAGCVVYDLHRAQDDNAEFVFVEYWRDAEALAAHDASPHMAALGRDLPPLLDRPPVIRKLAPADGA